MLLVVVRGAPELLLRRLVGAQLRDLEPEWATACALLIELGFETSPVEICPFGLSELLCFGTSPNGAFLRSFGLQIPLALGPLRTFGFGTFPSELL